ncbi:hypothetical protein BGX27_001644 [Mortierella sp. AM989]|nr:hypothetical protein BGX27_001644 [Mortierella sp. AM989]
MQEMLEIMARARKRTKNPKATLQIGVYWDCIQLGWEKVTPQCIRNCFCHVPTIPEGHRDFLRNLGVEPVEEQVNALQVKLLGKFKGMDEIISNQTDFSVMNYLLMCDCEGPSEMIFSSVMSIVKNENYSEFFTELKETNFIDEEEADDDEDLDPDYNVPRRQLDWKLLKVLRSRSVTALEEYYSMEPSPKKMTPNERYRIWDDVRKLLNKATPNELKLLDNLLDMAAAVVDHIRLKRDEEGREDIFNTSSEAGFLGCGDKQEDDTLTTN